MFWTRKTPFWGFHGSSNILQTLLVAPPSWFQDGGTENDVKQDMGRTFRTVLWWWWKMAALPLPAAILDDLIPWLPEIRSSETAAGSGRAAIFYHNQKGWKSSPYTTDFLLKLGKDYFKSISSPIKYFKCGFVPCFLTNIQLLIHSSAYFWT